MEHNEERKGSSLPHIANQMIADTQSQNTTIKGIYNHVQ
jgi:hypothetical protein